MPTAQIVLLVGIFFIVASASAQEQPLAPVGPATVTEAIFQSRWEAVQADSQQRRSAAGMLGVRTERDLFSPLSNFAETLREGLRLGPLDIHPGLAFGWEYSNVNSTNQATSSSDDSSFFVAPTILLQYLRDIGPWSVAASYNAGLRYYLNNNYTSAGVGGERNPFFQSASLSIGHLGARHALHLAASGTSGTGFNISSGENQAQTNIGVGLDYSYILTTYTNIGAAASYSTSVNSGASGSGNGNLSSYSGSLFADWLATGKTRLSLVFSAGLSSQDLQNNAGVNRSDVQLLLRANFTLTEKILVDAGLGVRYLQNTGVTDQNQSYVGARPAYDLGVSYAATEKTSLRASLSLMGTDIRPNFRLEARWQPRINTGLSLAAYQSQGFSLDTVDQVQVSRGIIGSLNQRLFSKINLTFSAGWQQTENLSLSNAGAASAQSGTTWSYAFASAGFTWSFNDWASWSTVLWTSSGNNSPGQSQSTPENRVTVSFNLTF